MLSFKNNRISLSKAFTLSAVVGYLVFSYCQFNSQQTGKRRSEFNQSDHVHQLRQKKETKSILIWNGAERVEVKIFGHGKDVFANQNCSYTRCELVVNRTEQVLQHYDAIVVVLNDEYFTPDQLMMPDFQNKRNQSQRLVFFTQEAPTALKSLYNMTQLANVFNWTMTYRRNADIQLIYGRVIAKENAPRTPEEITRSREKALTKFIKPRHNKTKTATWMVSHCNTHSQREKYVAELNKYIDIDTYGPCGSHSCARHNLYSSDPKCYDLLESTYKFYFSFENAICPDYVTEKFFKVLAYDIVPVVYGGADYSQHAPPHSYIDARQFKPKELAAYIKILAANDTLYNEYFWWKEYYRVEMTLEERSRHAFCGLCQKLHEQENGDYQSYPDLESEWGDGKCKPFDPSWIS